MLKAVVGHSDDIDDADAAREALDACAAELAGKTPIAGLAFSGSAKDPRVLLDAIAARYPGLPVVGSSSMAELSSRIPHAEASYAVMLLAGDTVTAAVGFGTEAATDPRGAAKRAVDMAKARLGESPALCIAICNGTRVNISQALDGIVTALGVAVPVVGGASACEIAPELAVAELCGSEVLKDSIVVMLLGGRLRFLYALARGWAPLGTTHTVTKAQDNLLIEIDGRPAVDLYVAHLGQPMPGGATFVHHPLAVYESPEGDYYLRAGFALGPIPGSIITAGNVPQGATVRLTEYEREQVVDAAAAAAGRAREEWGEGAPAAALVFTCSTRKTILGTWTVREVEALGRELPGTPIAGFYAFSELAPFGPGKPSRVHNGSFVALLLGELGEHGEA